MFQRIHATTTLAVTTLSAMQQSLITITMNTNVNALRATLEMDTLIVKIVCNFFTLKDLRLIKFSKFVHLF